MKSFHNDKAIKKKYLARVNKHIKADNLIRGTGWHKGKGCAVGCTLEAYEHKRYETELGIPEWLAKIEDTLFEGMSLEKSKTWPKDFLKAIPIGVDLEQVKTPFIIKILEKNIKTLDSLKFNKNNNPKTVKAVKQSKNATLQMIDAHKNGGDLDNARSAAMSARWVAELAESTESVRWARSARAAAESAAKSAKYAAESARCAADSAAWAAKSSRWAEFVYNELADELLKLLKQCK